MDATESMQFRKHLFVDGNHSLSRILNVLKIFDNSKNLMLGIYLMDKGRFLHFNKLFKEVFGNRQDKILEKGWQAWFAMVDSEEAAWVKARIFDFFTFPNFAKSLALNYPITNESGKTIRIYHEILPQKLGKHAVALNFFYEISGKMPIKQAFSVHNTQEEALNISLREKEVLRFIADGFSSKQIADFLFISTHTATSHRKHLIEKFQARNTAQLVKKASKIMEL